MYQVNINYNLVDDSYSAQIVPFDIDGYQGRTVDCEYEDGVSYTDWCSFTGSYAQCQKYIKELGYYIS